MDQEIESLTIKVRADTQEFARELGNVRSQLDGGFANSLERAGQGLERGLLGALRRGSLGFEDLRNVALSVLSDIASASLSSFEPIPTSPRKTTSKALSSFGVFGKAGR